MEKMNKLFLPFILLTHLYLLLDLKNGEKAEKIITSLGLFLLTFGGPLIVSRMILLSAY